MGSPDDAFQNLVLEAVRACGADLQAIERYVAQRMDAMDAAERERISRDVRRLLSFQAPGFRESRSH